ncbi:SDR family NAD(P)-dependent oxidoreductase [Shinella sp. 838]|jgi:NAD(P)-dependent dehydrogenase (short-subunit alcohol dehydrogenase family)|uniref:SDR family NAD(P)-dependent oxidoreductase n=2 Tax=Shinella TaxID=323620 RepID=UPI0003C53923|nr:MULTISPECIES: SDR family NAD(P)-dependent oxidoreductase [unclassified Shinella]EYR78928.1 short-chain dehydrogenase/reductase SDR [Shinella sp. DD12]MCA0340293.1 SDR family NAD(P)-dependent oxidoreductase [Pseudomonadota bacterium]MDG4673751.1 SDR family NAD(P)-dependent oxidoreductase [Shinella sp. 838]
MTTLRDIIKEANVAVITGGGAGIGLAAARRFAEAGMSIAIADLNADRLGEARAELEAIAGEANVMAVETDVAHRHELEALERAVLQRFGRVHVLMNNAGIQPDTSIFSAEANWDHILAVNLMGVIHGTQVFGPNMLAHGEAGLIINTGSKQGITTPPGNPAYNVSKAGVKVFTEALQHELRNTADAKLSAHLLIPGFVFTELTKGDRTEKPDAAWTPAQTVDFMMDSLERGDFYILCPDNDVSRALDERRMAWAIGDVIENRPPLSRWHRDFSGKFRAFVEGA